MTAPLVRFQRPTLPSAEAIERYLDAARGERWFSNSGPCWRLLRSRLSETTGRPCVPVSSGMLGLMVAIAALRDRAAPGAHEVLVPSFAFPASAQAGIWNGLQPVFVDVALDHWHLAPDRLEAALEERRGRVAMVVALSSFGVPPPPNVRKRWEAACAEAGVPLVVDSAAGFGAIASDGVPIGAQGDAEVVSFHATKPLAAGEGGAVFCRDPEIADALARIVNFGFDERRRVTRLDGINGKMSEPTAAIVLAALDELRPALDARRRRASELLGLLPASFVRQREHTLGTWQFVPLVAPSAEIRAAALDEAARRRIEFRTYYEPLHLMEPFAPCSRADDLAVTEEISRRALSLPMAVDLTSAEIGHIAAAIDAAVRVAEHSSVAEPSHRLRPVG